VALAVEVGLLAVLVVRAPAGPRALGRSVMALGAPALAASSLVLADHGSTGTALSLVCAICLFDLANYVMGTGASGGILGAVSGMAAVGVFALLAAGVIDPPFSGARPWVAFGILALLAPLGVVLGRRMAGGARLPALQRLDSLLLAGPAWIVTTHVLLR
jgi:hypothetical protein